MGNVGLDVCKAWEPGEIGKIFHAINPFILK